MLRSLMSGVTGVRAHQTLLDVVGNNIANVNTVGFKKSTVTFQDLMYQTTRGASSPAEGRGGINPMQVGLGVNVAAIGTIHSQGQTQFTGNRTDMAVQGDGYYVVSDGNNEMYTRAGNFLLDGNGNLAQAGTGYMVKGFAMNMDPIDPTKYTVGSSLTDINIPVGQKIPAKGTELAGYRCNLDSRTSVYLPMGITGNDASVSFDIGTDRFLLNNIAGGKSAGEFFTLAGGDWSIPLEFGGIDEATGMPQLTLSSTAPLATPAGITVLPAGVVFDSATGTLTISGTYPDPADPLNPPLPFSTKIEAAGFMNYSLVTDGSVSPAKYYLAEFDDVQTAGQEGFRTLRLWSMDSAVPPVAEVNELLIPVQDDGKFNLSAATPVGTSTLTARASENGLGIAILSASGDDLATINQKIASVHGTKMDVYDSLGNAHTLEVSWEKTDNNQWRWRAWLPEESGMTLTNNTGLVNFTPGGQIESGSTGEIGINFASLGAHDARITLDFTGESFGKGALEGVTQYGSAFTTKGYFQDGYAMGVLNDFATGKDGTITGVYSNGRNIPLYRVALALFSNPSGLDKFGDTAYLASNNSGLAQVVPPLEGGAGSIAGGTLEMGNVDLSEEFVRLIVAQRGFQASARVVTTSDQVLEELINIKR